MKKRLRTSTFILSILVSLTGCGSDSTSEYKVSKSEYQEILNPDNILFHNNYTVDMSINGQSYLNCKLNNGKALSTFSSTGQTTYYESTLNNENVVTYACWIDKYDGSFYEHTYNWTKNEFYSYFFYNWYVMIEVPYDDLTYNSNEHRYEINDYSIISQGTNYHFNYGYIYFLNKLPQYIEVNIDDIGLVKITFSDFGTTKTEKPQQQTFDPLTIRLSYTCDYSQQNDIIGWIGRCLTDIGCRQYEISTHDNNVLQVKVINPVDNFYSHNWIRAALLYSSTPTMTNAHDSVLSSFIDADSPAYVSTENGLVNVVVPIKEGSQNDFVSILQQSREDIELNKHEYGVPYMDGEGESEEYRYELYFWSYFDPEICVFANRYESDWYSRLLNKTYVTSDDSMFFNGEHYSIAIPISQDLNADGYVSSLEQSIALLHGRVIARLFNNEPNDFGLYLTND